MITLLTTITTNIYVSKICIFISYYLTLEQKQLHPSCFNAHCKKNTRMWTCADGVSLYFYLMMWLYLYNFLLVIIIHVLLRMVKQTVLRYKTNMFIYCIEKQFLYFPSSTFFSSFIEVIEYFCCCSCPMMISCSSTIDICNLSLKGAVSQITYMT